MKTTKEDCKFMGEAIRLANESVRQGGGPFGAVIVKDGKIIAGSSNSVTIDNDPSTSQVAGYIPRASLVRCVWVLSTGHILSVSIMVIRARMPVISILPTISSMRNWINLWMSAPCPSFP